MTQHVRYEEIRSAGFAKPAIIGFLLPFALAVLIGLLLHAATRPVITPEPIDADTLSATGSSTTSAGSPPSADEVTKANAAILSYCRNDLRKDTNCTLIANSNKTAPGFVESGVRMSGRFEGQNTITDGQALAKGSGSSWTVIWVGQGCIPKNVAEQNKVAGSLNVCAS